jgi:hypothetical protein
MHSTKQMPDQNGAPVRVPVSTPPAGPRFRVAVALFGVLFTALSPEPARAQGKPVVGLIPKAQKPIKLGEKLAGWDGAFVTPVHVGHPDFANRGGLFYFLWDEKNLYVGLKCLDQKIAHVGTDNQIWNGDAVEFYLDVRRGTKLGEASFGPGTLHLFYTGFTGTEIKPRIQVRDLPAFRDFKLKDAEVAASKTPWGYVVEFKLPWSNFPDFMPKDGEELGIDCELCSSDGGPRVDRSFVYSSPASVNSPASFGRVRLVEKIDPAQMKPFGRALLPLSVTKSANYDWLYATAGVSPTIAAATAKLEGRIVDADGKTVKTTPGSRQTLEGSGFVLWSGKWELFDLKEGTYTLEVTARDKDGKVLTSHALRLLHGQAAPEKETQNPSPMVEHTRAHVRLKEERLPGRREKLSIGTLFLPEGLNTKGPVTLLVHFHGAQWIAEQAVAGFENVAVISVQLGTGSTAYAKPFADPKAFSELIKEAEEKAGTSFSSVGLTAWSAGYGAVREILRVPEHYQRVAFVALLDGLHAGYVGGKPGPKESSLKEEDLDVFVRFARDAAAGPKRMLITHSEVFPGTFASTTETADYLLKKLDLRRRATLQWGPVKMQQVSQAVKGQFELLGYAGNAAPDHVDHLHALPEFVRLVLSKVSDGAGK